ncbi:hypothetical protein EON79_05670 [bacterium]|nr:MAG: hypothetical protein EON79_05670 [bacterium]
MRRIVPLFLLLLATSAFAQTDEKRPSRSAAAIQSVANLIRNNVAGASNPKKAEVAAKNPMHVVFLVDTSQAGKDDYIEFTAKFIDGVLKQLGGDQAEAKVADDGLHDVQFFPYQMDLIELPDRALTPARPLKKGAGTVQAIKDLLPHQRIPVPGEGMRGHLSAKARRTLIDKLGSSQGARETLIVQITPREIDSDPDHPENDIAVKRQSAYNALLAGTDYVAYNEGGSKWQTDPPGDNVPSTDVFVWVYGPSKFNLPAVAPVPVPTPIEIEREEPKKGLPIALFAGLGVLALVVGYVIYRFVAKFPVKVGDERGWVTFSSPLAIKSAGGKGGGRAILIAKERQGGVGPDIKLGEVTVPLLFGGPRVFGSGGYTMKQNAATPPVALPLTKKPIAVAFTKPDGSTDLINISL